MDFNELYLKMFLAYVLIIWNILSYSFSNAENTRITKEYCDWESLNATCKQNEIIIIKKAFYGRMNLGRCVLQDFGNIGCETEVTSQIDRKCSGRRHCSFPVMSYLHGKSICSNDLKNYLEVDYDCVKAGSDNVTSCPPEGYITMTSPSGQIASSLVHENGIGGPKCPVRVRVEEYQHLNITIIDFSVPIPSDIWFPLGHYEPFKSSCEQNSGFILESDRTAKIHRNVSICVAGESSGSRLKKRTATIYMSKGNEVDLVINSDTPNTFLLMYYAIGCPPIEPPLYANVRRSGDMAVVECNDTHQTWYLTCGGTQWVGTIGNCTKLIPVVLSDGDKQTQWDFNSFIANMTTYPYGILIVVALGIAIGVAIGVLLLAMVLAYLRQRRLKKIRSRSSHYILKASESEYEDGGIRNSVKCTSLTDSSSLLTKREDPYTCPSLLNHEIYPIMDHQRTMQIRHISPIPDDHVIMTSLPDPPIVSPPPALSTTQDNTTSRSNSTKKKKKDKTMDYNWDSLSVNENEINELSDLRENLRIPRQRNAFSIAYNDQGKPKHSDEPYYFKFDGVVGYKINRDTPRPDIVPAACSACNYNTDNHNH